MLIAFILSIQKENCLSNHNQLIKTFWDRLKPYRVDLLSLFLKWLGWIDKTWLITPFPCFPVFPCVAEKLLPSINPLDQDGTFVLEHYITPQLNFWILKQASKQANWPVNGLFLYSCLYWVLLWAPSLFQMSFSWMPQGRTYSEWCELKMV